MATSQATTEKKKRLQGSFQAGHGLVKDANLISAHKWLGCQLSDTEQVLQNQLSRAVHTNPQHLLIRQAFVGILRINQSKLSNWNKKFERIHQLEEELVPFFKVTSTKKEDLEEDALGQLTFQHELLKPINHIPWAIAIIAAFKVWAVPAMTVLFPLIAWLLPYLLLKFVYTLPISQDQYLTILKSLWSGSLGSPLEMGEDGLPVLPSFWNSKSLMQIGLFGFSFLQSLIQPIQTAMHLHNTDTLFWGVGKQLLELRELVQELREDLKLHNCPPFKISAGLFALDPSDYRRSFLLVKEQPERLFLTLKDIAGLEILWRLAGKVELNPVVFKKSEFRLRDCIDISIEADPVASSIKLDSTKQPHTVITGPNGGGKSSFLRAVLQSVLFAHTYGVVPARAAVMPRFLWIASGLQLRDTPGKLSMFETEVQYAAQVLQMSRRSPPGLVLFDELFHSTNPPDGARTAQLFLKNLWKSTSIFSIVSTHVFPLVEAAPSNVLAICCPAEESEDGRIDYKYAVEPGICRVSSVKKVWERFGLVESSTATPQ